MKKPPAGAGSGQVVSQRAPWRTGLHDQGWQSRPSCYTPCFSSLTVGLEQEVQKRRLQTYSVNQYHIKETHALDPTLSRVGELVLFRPKSAGSSGGWFEGCMRDTFSRLAILLLLACNPCDRRGILPNKRRILLQESGRMAILAKQDGLRCGTARFRMAVADFLHWIDSEQAGTRAADPAEQRTDNQDAWTRAISYRKWMMACVPRCRVGRCTRSLGP